ncbi:MAG TPA: OmpW family outer membrane protein [Mycobacterium sp.]|nr:OmpW family outer membrane protein [Mycobacterium sp.]
MSKVNRTGLAIGLGVVAAGLSGQSMALGAGDFVVYAGAAYISPSSSIGGVTDSIAPLTAATSGATAKVKSATAAIFSGFYMVTDHLAVELTIGVPPTLKTDINVPNAGGPIPNAISQKAEFPSLVGKYLFLSPTDAFRPYVGVGVNNTSFSSVVVSGNPVAQTFAGSGASLSSSWNPVVNAGAIFEFTSHLSLNVGVSYVPMSSNVALRGAGEATGNVATAKLRLDPTDVTFKIGYKF